MGAFAKPLKSTDSYLKKLEEYSVQILDSGSPCQYVEPNSDGLTYTSYYSGSVHCVDRRRIGSVLWGYYSRSGSPKFIGRYKLVGNGSGRIVCPINASGFFAGFEAITKIKGVPLLYTGFTTDMSSFFSGCTEMVTFELYNFNTSQCRTFSRMFENCAAVTSLNLSSFNWKKAKNTSRMFSGCAKLTSLNLGSIDLGSIDSLAYMFYGCAAMKAFSFSGSALKADADVKYMFANCTGITSIDAVKGLDTSVIKDLSYMFSGCTGIKEISLNTIDTSKVEIMQGMFSTCTGATVANLSDRYMPKIVNMSSMFEGCTALKEIYFPYEQTANVETMAKLFKGCTALTKVDLGGLVISDGADMTSMFYECSSLTSVDLSALSSKISVNLDSAFYKCTALTQNPFEGFDGILKPSKINNALSHCENITKINFDHIDFSQTSDLRGMCSYCTGLKTVSFNVTLMDGANITGLFGHCSSLEFADFSNLHCVGAVVFGQLFNGLFVNCTALTTVDFSGAIFEGSAHTSFMFFGCTALKSVDLSGATFNGTVYAWDMFYGCTSLTTVNLSSIDASKITNANNMFQNCSALTSITFYGTTGCAASMQAMLSGCSSLSYADLSLFSFSTMTVSNLTNIFKDAGAHVETLVIEVASQEDINFITTNAESLGLPGNAVVQIKATT